MCNITYVLHVPSFSFYLISVSKLSRSGLCAKFTSERVHILRGYLIIATGTQAEFFYRLDTLGMVTNVFVCVASLQIWNERMGHVHSSGLQQMARKMFSKVLT